MNNLASVESFFDDCFGMGDDVRIHCRLGAFPAGFCLALVRLNEVEQALQRDEEAFVAAFLSPEERELFAAYSYSKRRREWLGGRLAAKAAVAQLLEINGDPAAMAALSILPSENGSPRLETFSVNAAERPALSISHSGDYGAAMAVAAGTCGIDIQKILAKTERLADRFSEEREVRLLQDSLGRLREEERLTLLWSAKEALKKALRADQPVIFQGIVLQSLEADQYATLRFRCPDEQDCPAEVIGVQFGEYMFAYAIGEIKHA